MAPGGGAQHIRLSAVTGGFEPGGCKRANIGLHHVMGGPGHIGKARIHLRLARIVEPHKIGEQPRQKQADHPAGAGEGVRHVRGWRVGHVGEYRRTPDGVGLVLGKNVGWALAHQYRQRWAEAHPTGTGTGAERALPCHPGTPFGRIRDPA